MATTTTSPSSTTAPEFTGAITVVNAARLGHSWREGCPVEPEDLRLVTFHYWDFEGMATVGDLIVHSDEARSVLAVFEGLFDDQYPIASITPIGDLPVDAEDDPAYSNTSGFNCRLVEGTQRWSEHASGLAIDLNPHLNPQVIGKEVWPTGSDDYVDRTKTEPGMIHAGDAVTKAFAAVNWSWGGNWDSLKDYHHFSRRGR
jgi:hypothetical protein